MIKETVNAVAIADELIALIQSASCTEYIGEPVTILQHMTQSAMIAQQKNLSEELILAAFLHDIGHVCEAAQFERAFMKGFGMVNHEKIGAAFLREKGFSTLVIQVVENHVAAKRYLCTVSPSYYASLSEASKETLILQGMLMSDEEINEFISLEYFPHILEIRKIDELAKVINIPAPDNFDYYHQLIVRHLNQQNQLHEE